MQLSTLLKKFPKIHVSHFAERAISDITHDSRETTPNSIFVAIRGKRFDGRKFIEKCQAKVIIVDEEPSFETQKTVVLVENARKAMANIACELYDHPSQKMKMIGLTGTNGKTTTAWMLYHILRNSGQNVGVIGTLGHHINGNQIPRQIGHTTPESSHIQAMLQKMVENKCDTCVMEVSSIGLDLFRVEGIQYDVAAFTNFTQDHLDFHADMEQYFDAKSRLFKDLLHQESVSILNQDQEKISTIAIAKGKKWTFGCNANANWKLIQIEPFLTHINARFAYQQTQYSLKLPLVGKHNIENAIVAISSSHALGIPVQQAIDTLEKLPQVAGRVERIETNTGWQAFVDYAHTPDALKKVLITLREVTKGKLVVVFGCGGDRDTEKRPLMGKIASTFADSVFVTSDNPRHEKPDKIIADIAKGIIGEATYITDRKIAIQTAIQSLSVQDVLLIAGKGHENYQIIGDTKRHFDDRIEVLESL